MLDENFIMVRAAVNLSLSGDLSGFHLYGTDLCAVASFLGYTAYVVDFHLRHERRDVIDDAFARAATGFVHKYARTMWPTVLTTICTQLVITPSPFLNRIGETRHGTHLIRFATHVVGAGLRWAGPRRCRPASLHGRRRPGLRNRRRSVPIHEG